LKVSPELPYRQTHPITHIISSREYNHPRRRSALEPPPAAASFFFVAFGVEIGMVRVGQQGGGAAADAAGAAAGGALLLGVMEVVLVLVSTGVVDFFGVVAGGLF